MPPMPRRRCLNWMNCDLLCGSKTNQAWIWIALCRKTRQVVDYARREIEANRHVVACGRPFQQPTVPGTATRIFGRSIRQSFRKSSTALWERKPGKPLMWSAGITRLSQRLARFVRKTLSFSKSLLMHHACLNLFLHRYNHERAIMLM